MLDINRPNVFIHVAATQSCSEAAKRLHLSQPTVSKPIQNLEVEPNVKLLERDGARLRITNAGMTLLLWARKIVRQTTHVQETMEAMQDCIVGQLWIACTSTSLHAVRLSHALLLTVWKLPARTSWRMPSGLALKRQEIRSCLTRHLQNCARHIRRGALNDL